MNFWMHYMTTGKEEKDMTSLWLYFYRGKPSRVYSVVQLSNKTIRIPAGEKEYRISASHVFDEDVVVTSLTPHMHYRGKSMRLTAHYPDGSQEILLSVPDFKFNWQRRYILAKPKDLPAGTRVRVDIDAAPISPEEFRRRIDEACGAWADDDSIEAIFREILESRHRARPRDVNFDVSS
jgi:hypothetical protein